MAAAGQREEPSRDAHRLKTRTEARGHRRTCAHSGGSVLVRPSGWAWAVKGAKQALQQHAVGYSSVSTTAEMSPHGLRGADARFRPFLSSSLDEYLKRYWAIVFTVGSQVIDTGHMRHYLSWYATRLKVVELDHHMHATSLREQLITKAGTPALPLLFVNQKLVGTIADVRSYEERRLLKDIVQFGFQWKTGAALDCAPQPLNTLPSPYGDTELFRGRYRGAPVARPIVQLPQLHPHRRQDD